MTPCLAFVPFRKLLDSILYDGCCDVVRELTRNPWWSQSNKDCDTQNDLTSVQIDTATVTETIIALAELQSKRVHRWVVLIVLTCATLAGFSTQIVGLAQTVR